MNEVSIIINGVRYDAIECDMKTACDNQCELDCDTFCGNNFVMVCKDIIGLNRIFKKSDKKFEV